MSTEIDTTTVKAVNRNQLNFENHLTWDEIQEKCQSYLQGQSELPKTMTEALA